MDHQDLDIADSVLDLIGKTPMVKLPRIGKDTACPIVAKLETTNPGGSSKDRPAVTMIDEAEEAGLLLPGGTIIEPTSGNTGVGLAIVAAQRGYKCIFVMTDKVSSEKVALLEAYGAEVVVCPVAVAPEDPRSYYSTAERLVTEIPNAYRPNQYHNQANPKAHYLTTGPEIWEQTQGKITHFVAGAGTGGTITGVGRFLKEQNPDVQIIAADPTNSVYSGGSGRPYLVEGVGEDFWPDTYDPAIVDSTIAVTDAESFAMAHRVTVEEGILIGGSGGTAVAAALQIAENLTAQDLVVVLIPDSGRGYLSKVFDKSWMANMGFSRQEGPTIADLLDQRTKDQSELAYVSPESNLEEAISIMQERGLPGIPVANGEMPLAAAEVMGSVFQDSLLEESSKTDQPSTRKVQDVMGPNMPTVGVGESLTVAATKLENSQVLLVLDDGQPRSLLTRSDLAGSDI
ncbi:MAG: cystathionine beta-synthase [Acidimicrobiales bacterium]|jgi:cystathionine beta-synthase|nr:cystathionine beta-synthase [Acidimicrobiales bacterium]|tara:strand:- start:8749 stop:10119 length:1371 start_codon:yes stop_codon:yes gene_type:complete